MLEVTPWSADLGAQFQPSQNECVAVITKLVSSAACNYEWEGEPLKAEDFVIEKCCSISLFSGASVFGWSLRG